MKRHLIAAAAALAIAALASCVGDGPNSAVVLGDAAVDGTLPPQDAQDASSQDAVADASIDAPVDAAPDATGDGGIGGVGGMMLWFAGDTNVATDGLGKVVSWTSRAGEPLVLKSEANEEPTVGKINTRPSVHFGGHAYNVPCPCPGLGAVLPQPIPQPLTIFAVVKSDRWTDNTANYSGIVFTDYPVNLKLYTAIFPGPAPAWAISAGTELLSVGQTGADHNKPRLFTAVFDGVSSIFRLNGGNQRAGSTGTAGLTASISLGHDGNPINSFQGDIGDLVFYGRVLPLAEMTAVEAALKSKWGIP